MPPPREINFSFPSKTFFFSIKKNIPSWATAFFFIVRPYQPYNILQQYIPLARCKFGALFEVWESNNIEDLKHVTRRAENNKNKEASNQSLATGSCLEENIFVFTQTNYFLAKEK